MVICHRTQRRDTDAAVQERVRHANPRGAEDADTKGLEEMPGEDRTHISGKDRVSLQTIHILAHKACLEGAVARYL